MKKTAIQLLLVLAFFAVNCTNTQKTEEVKEETTEKVDYLKESDEAREARMAWWKDARFGMFIHWGLYAVPAGEWDGKRTDNIAEWIMHHLNIPIAEYEKFSPQFNPTKFNAEQWVSIAKNAGMKYIVITSKHHDGFALWDSKVSDWDITDASPYEKDLLKELAEACKKEGITLCFYHSIMDWHHPDAQAIWEPNYNRGRDDTDVNPNFNRYVENYMKPQLKELLTDYGDIGVLWFDGEWIPDYTTDMGKEIYQFVREQQPDIIINNRVDKGRKGMEGLDAEGDFAGDFGTPEQEIPETGLPGVDWESCMTMNDSWGYKYFDENWKSNETLIRNLVDIASKGGNFLLNVGPTAEGLIPEPSVERLAAMGEWMKVNNESIYGTTASPIEAPEWGRVTKKDDNIYLHVFDWPSNGELMVKGLEKSPKSATLLASGESLNVTTEEVAVTGSTEAATTITVSNNAPDEICSVIKLQL